MSDVTNAYGLLGLGAEVTGTAGSAVTGVNLDRIRSGVLLTVDAEASAPVYFKVVPRGAAAPTISEATFHLRVSPGSDRTVGWGGTLDVYAFAASPTGFTAVPVRF